MDSWVKEEIEVGKGSFIGFFYMTNDSKSLIEIQRRKLLYPSYAQY